MKAVLAAGAAAAAWGVLVERELFTIRRVTLPLLPAGSPDLTVLHLSDLHMAPWQRHKQRFVRELGELEPDLVVDTGDNLGHPIGLLGLGPRSSRSRACPACRCTGRTTTGRRSRRTRSGTSAARRRPRRCRGGSTPPRSTTTSTSLGWTDLNNRTARLSEGACRSTSSAWTTRTASTTALDDLTDGMWLRCAPSRSGPR